MHFVQEPGQEPHLERPTRVQTKCALPEGAVTTTRPAKRPTATAGAAIFGVGCVQPEWSGESYPTPVLPELCEEDARMLNLLELEGDSGVLGDPVAMPPSQTTDMDPLLCMPSEEECALVSDDCSEAQLDAYLQAIEQALELMEDKEQSTEIPSLPSPDPAFEDPPAEPIDQALDLDPRLCVAPLPIASEGPCVVVSEESSEPQSDMEAFLPIHPNRVAGGSGASSLGLRPRGGLEPGTNTARLRGRRRRLGACVALVLITVHRLFAVHN